MNEITFTYQRNKEDVLAQTIWHRMIKSRFFLGLNILFPSFGIASLIMTIGMPLDAIQYIAIIYLTMYPVTTYFLIKFRINSIFKNPEVEFDATTFTFSYEGINTASDKGEFLLGWDQLYKVYDTKKYIYIYINKSRSLLINKAFVGEDNVERIIEMIQKYTIKGQFKVRRLF